MRVKCVALIVVGFLLTLPDSLVADKNDGLKIHRVDSPTVFAIAFSPNGSLLAIGGTDGEIALWDIRSDRLRSKIKASDAPVPMAFGKRGTVLVGANSDGTIVIFDATTGERLTTFDSRCQSYAALSVSPSGDRLVTVGLDDKARLWSLPTGDFIATFDQKQICTSSFLTDNTLIAGTRDKRIHLWSIETSESLAELDAGKLRITSLCAASDGKSFAFTTGMGDAFGGQFTLCELDTSKSRTPKLTTELYPNLVRPQLLDTPDRIIASAAEGKAVICLDRSTRHEQEIVSLFDLRHQRQDWFVYTTTSDGKQFAIAHGPNVVYADTDSLPSKRQAITQLLDCH